MARHFNLKPQIKKDNLELARPDLESQYEQPAQFEAGLKHSKTQQLRQHTGTLKSVYEHHQSQVDPMGKYTKQFGQFKEAFNF